MKKDPLVLAQKYDFKFTYEFYDYIMDSLINGQRKQVVKLWSELENYYRDDCLTHIKSSSSIENYIELLELLLCQQ